MLREHHLPVRRTARYHTLGDPRGPVRDVWFVCHGYGQLAGRFLRWFESLADESRLLVAPEALSRFYIETPNVSHAQSPVGATWMTREDRLSEIDDYIAYLDALYAQIFQEVDRGHVRVVVLGFSQGVATVWRWVARGSARVDQLVLWGALVPPDLDLGAHAEQLRAVDLVIVAGDQDSTVEASLLAEQRERLARAGLAARTITYAGGHRINADALREIVALAPLARE